LDDISNFTINNLDKYQNQNIELSNSVNEKLKLHNTKVDIFKNEMSKIWKYEENIFLELDKIKLDINHKQNSMMKFYSKSNLVESTATLREKLKSKRDLLVESDHLSKTDFESHKYPLNETISSFNKYKTKSAQSQ